MNMFHVKVGQVKSLLSTVIIETTGVTASEAQKLLSLGAVYRLPASTTEGKATRALKDIEVDQNDYIRIHTDPRRYPIAHEIDWTRRIIAETDHFFVIDKPSGVPSHAILENLHENVVECMKTCLTKRGLVEPTLYLPQRLDVETSGLLVLAKSSSMIAKYNDWLKRDRISKHYKALLAFNVLDPISTDLNKKLGGVYAEGDIVQSYLDKNKIAPKRYFWQQSEQQPRQDCTLRIERIKPLIMKTRADWLSFAATQLQPTTSTASLSSTEEDLRLKLKQALQQWMGSGNPKDNIALQEVSVELITGRTHQVRGQLQLLKSHPEAAKVGSRFHLAGDNLYHGCTSEHIDDDDNSHGCPFLTLQACGLTVNTAALGFEHKIHFSLQQPWWHLLYAAEELR